MSGELVLLAVCDCGFEELVADPLKGDEAALAHEESNEGHGARLEVPPETPGAEARNLVLAKCREMLRLLDNSAPVHTPTCSCGWEGCEWSSEAECWIEADDHAMATHGHIDRAPA